MIERTCRHAARFAEGFQQAGYRVLNDVVINQVLVSERHQALLWAVGSLVQAFFPSISDDMRNFGAGLYGLHFAHRIGMILRKFV